MPCEFDETEQGWLDNYQKWLSASGGRKSFILAVIVGATITPAVAEFYLTPEGDHYLQPDGSSLYLQP